MIQTVPPLADAAANGSDFFRGFREGLVAVPEGEIFARVGGEGPPLLLLHGYPQTSAIWHRVAPDLAETYTVVCADLRGYGRSHKPPTQRDHGPYSKRAMAGDMAALMSALGFERFSIAGHDRGGRVAHRLALDHPDRVTALATLDIAPTREMYAEARSAFAQSYWHWYWLSQPAPFPETLIGADPDFFWLKKCGSGSAGMAPFQWEALNEYLSAFRDPAVIHATCEDYRAARTIDIAHDDADAGRKVTAPLLALWGAQGAIQRHFDCLDLWRRRAERASGQALPGGHYLPEELPRAVSQALIAFFAETSA